MMMKNIIILLFICTSSLVSCQIYPLSTSSSHVPNGAYIKDTNNELDKYVGVWKGVWNGKTVFLDLRRYKKYHPGVRSYYIDEIVGGRKIINSNGVVEIDKISNFNYNSAEFYGMFISLRYAGNKRFLFFPDDMCNKSASLDITSFETVSVAKMTLNMKYEPSYYDANCPHNAYVAQHDDWPVNFPKDIVLIKQ